MKHSKRKHLFWVLVLLFWSGYGLVYSQNSSLLSNNNPPKLPMVFLLGENDQGYEHLSSKYTTLLDACGNDMNLAFEKLQSMMLEMQAYAKLTGFNLKDVKCWMHIFWNNNGTIDHLGFFLKPNSRNIDVAEFKTFLSTFALQYKFPLYSDAKYAHYSTFSFPVVQPKQQQNSSGINKEMVRRDNGGQ